MKVFKNTTNSKPDVLASAGINIPSPTEKYSITKASPGVYKVEDNQIEVGIIQVPIDVAIAVDLGDKSQIEIQVADLGYKVDEVEFSTPYHNVYTNSGTVTSLIRVYHTTDEVKNELPYGLFTVRMTNDGLRIKAQHHESNSNVKLIKNHDLKSVVKAKFENFGNDGRKNKSGILLYGPPGCHAKDEKVMMADGSFKAAQDIVLGDFLMGPDSKPREVLKLITGQDEMVRITPTKGESFIVNYNHVMHLTPSGENPFQCPVNISVKNLVENTSKCAQERFKLTRTSSIDFPKKDVMINPYLFGFWLGDGSSDSFTFHTADDEIKDYLKEFCEQTGSEFVTRVERENNFGSYKVKKIEGRTNPFIQELKQLEVFNNKHIPDVYLKNDKQSRLELLAGLIDSDGHLKHSNGGYEFSSMHELFANQVVYLSRSLGLAAYITKEYKVCQTGNGGWYYRISISGNIDQIPVKIPRKIAQPRKQIKSVLRTGFTVEKLGQGEFFGFTISDDHLYLDAHFNIQHNCGKTTEILELVDLAEEMKLRVFLVDSKTDIEYLDMIRPAMNGARTVFVLEEMTERLRGGIEDLLTFLDGEKSWINSVTIATTNYPEDFPANLVDRPGRFETFIEYGNPTAEDITKLGEAFGFSEEQVSCLFKQQLSFDYVSYMLSLAKKNGTSVKEARDAEEEKRRRLSSTFKGKIGF